MNTLVSKVIAQSKHCAEIINIHADVRNGEYERICEELDDACEGSATLDISAPREYWGIDCYGKEWRVHVHAQRED